jgi:hypothetical protein
LPKGLENRFPGTYPLSDDESEEDIPEKKETALVVSARISSESDCHTVEPKPAITKARQYTRIKVKVKSDRKIQRGREFKKSIKRNYIPSSYTEVYYL